MSEDSMLMCLIAFVLGFLVSRMMRGNGLSIGGLDIHTILKGCAISSNCQTPDLILDVNVFCQNYKNEEGKRCVSSDPNIMKLFEH